MYSNNDYRYYLERQLIHSDDFLAHYGIKNMKWGKKKRRYMEEEIREVARQMNSNPVKDQIRSGKDTTKNIASDTIKEYNKPINRIKRRVNRKKNKSQIKMKRSKKDEKWNKQMQQYGKEVLKEMQ